jgi:16S rRNA (cytosine967-C5)-methyltransferase
MYYDSYCNAALRLIQAYDGKLPLQYFLKQYFAENKKFGSTDRRQITGLCYAYFRLGHALGDLSATEKILTGLFLSGQTSSGLLHHFKPQWNEQIHLPLEQKLPLVGERFSITDIFPWGHALSEGINHESFCESFLSQPDLFIRIRPGNLETVKSKLTNKGIGFRLAGESCIALRNSTKIEQVIALDREAVIQDYNSQKIQELFPQSVLRLPSSVWDCCAGSGGKSILLFDLNHQISLTVSDIRKSILVNLKKRFEAAGIKKYRSFCADLGLSGTRFPMQNTDLIIADIPCSGSGTWSRTPESLSFFHPQKLDGLTARQKKIIDNLVPCLHSGGSLLYITCSVFRMENEAMADYIVSKHGLRLDRSEILKGNDQKADTLFGARFTV